MFITQSSQMTPKQLIERAHVELMGNEDTVEYSGILMLGTYEVRDDIPTACTDGINCKYGSKFMVGLTDAERRGVILHEKLHMVYQHMFLWKHLREINPKLANMACDYVINIHIVDLDRKTNGFVKLPKGSLFDERFRGMDSQQVFNILQGEQDDEGDDSEQGDGDGDGDEGLAGFRAREIGSFGKPSAHSVFASRSLALAPGTDLAALGAALAAPDSGVLRAKALLADPHRPDGAGWLLQVAGGRWQVTPAVVQGPGRLVLIGLKGM